MKKNIGNQIGLYPTPLAVVGATVNGKTNWVLVGHLGIMGHDRIMISLAKAHYTNQGIKENGVLSVNLVDERLLPKADYVGSVSGANTDKSQVFNLTIGLSGAPMIADSPLVMECKVVDNYETDGFDNFVLSIENTHVEEQYLTEQGKIDYGKLKPVLFEMPTYEYLKTGEIIGKCRTFGKDLK